MLLQYLKNKYKENEPIFSSDITLPLSANNLRQQLKRLCDDGSICRFDSGIYFLPKKTRLKGGTAISPDIVIRYKYVERNNHIDGYYSGYTFANQLGITTQVPVVIEVVSNNASANVREVLIKNRKIVLRKSRITITEQNYRILQLLDLLKDIELYSDPDKPETISRIQQYILDEKITKKDVDQYVGSYPDRIYKTIYNMRLYNVFA